MGRNIVFPDKENNVRIMYMDTKLKQRRTLPSKRLSQQRSSSQSRQDLERQRVLGTIRNSKPMPMVINSRSSPQTAPIRSRPRSPSLFQRFGAGGVKKIRQQTIKNERGRTYAVKTIKPVTSCSKVLTFAQQGAICWFTALITTLFFSQYTRVVMRMHARKMVKYSNTRQIADAMLQLIKGYDSGKVSRRVVEHMQPHQFLQDLRATRSNLFDSTLNGSSEAHYNPYVHKILGFLRVPHLGIGIVGGKILYSGFNVDLPLDSKLWAQAMKTQSPRGTFVDTNNPEVLLLHRDGGEDYIQGLWGSPRPALGSVSGISNDIHNKIIQYNGRNYILDSCILGGEVRTQSCSVAHAVAGVTCNNNRYIYNGWTARSGDPAMSGSGSVIKDMPCSLMAADWAANKAFCINTAACKMNIAKPNQLSKELCFNGVARSTVVYIRSDLAKLGGYKVIGKQVRRPVSRQVRKR
ncbi:hypothetical protein PBCVNEJV4_715R [Paramecium bursaria Chlorella virus NE-JV-4]|nr:hypothetical protein PBCVNEJV4_715R [Paramecium bursaria Chlorella virus NE-JV-4]